MKNEKVASGISMEKYPILHPHRILSYLWNDVGIEISQSDVAQFWRHSREFGEPFATDNPASCAHVPIGIHGDSARLWTQYKFEKITGISMNLPLFRPRSIRHSRFLLISIPTEKLVKNRTVNEVWKRLLWSLQSAFHGVNPPRGMPGRPLSEADIKRSGSPLTRTMTKFALTELRGDWEWHRDVWRPSASWISNVICFKCPALARGDEKYLYYNHGSTCEWLQEEFGLAQFISRRLRNNNL